MAKKPLFNFGERESNVFRCNPCVNILFFDCNVFECDPLVDVLFFGSNVFGWNPPIGTLFFDFEFWGCCDMYQNQNSQQSSEVYWPSRRRIPELPPWSKRVSSRDDAIAGPPDRIPKWSYLFFRRFVGRARSKALVWNLVPIWKNDFYPGYCRHQYILVRRARSAFCCMTRKAWRKKGCPQRLLSFDLISSQHTSEMRAVQKWNLCREILWLKENAWAGKYIPSYRMFRLCGKLGSICTVPCRSPELYIAVARK